jgi:tetratricopeptide (TPR) repeat protein
MAIDDSKPPVEFQRRLEAARRAVTEARAGNDNVRLAQALKQLGSIERRPPFMYEMAIGTFTEASELFHELGMRLDEAWCIRHIGIIREYQYRLEDAERAYDKALALYREHAEKSSLDYANTVRYPAVVKNRLGKREDATRLWEEAHDRYKQVGPSGLGEGVAEAAAWLTVFAIEASDRGLAEKWFQRASEASSASNDPDTHKFVAEVEARLQQWTEDSDCDEPGT